MAERVGFDSYSELGLTNLPAASIGLSVVEETPNILISNKVVDQQLRLVLQDLTDPALAAENLKLLRRNMLSAAEEKSSHSTHSKRTMIKKIDSEFAGQETMSPAAIGSQRVIWSST